MQWPRFLLVCAAPTPSGWLSHNDRALEPELRAELDPESAEACDDAELEAPSDFALAPAVSASPEETIGVPAWADPDATFIADTPPRQEGDVRSQRKLERTEVPSEDTDLIDVLFDEIQVGRN